MREIVFRAKDLYFSYDGKKNALDGASLDLYAGERLAVLGANGAGKSTFFLCLNGVLDVYKRQGRGRGRGRVQAGAGMRG